MGERKVPYVLSLWKILDITILELLTYMAELLVENYTLEPKLAMNACSMVHLCYKRKLPTYCSFLQMKTSNRAADKKLQ